MSLKEIIAGKTHTTLGDFKFDCTPVIFTPPG